MWKLLPQQGSELREVRLEGTGKDRELIIAPKAGASIRFPAGDVSIDTVGRVSVRVTTTESNATRIIFSGETFMLERAEVDFDGSEIDWESMWRRARTRSRPWWRHDGANEELDLDWVMSARLLLTASTTRSSARPPSIRPPSQ